jgi:hypothetical protein
VLDTRRAVTATFVGTEVPMSTLAVEAVVETSAFSMHWIAQPPETA